MQKIILDTDIGDDIDDALALTFAMLCSEVKVLGVTTVFRNTEKRAELACCVLEALGRTDVPVYVGLGKRLMQSADEWRTQVESHRPRQMEVLGKQRPSVRPQKQRAVEYIVDTVMASDEEITLVPVGPFTNIAAALTLEPRIAEKAKICMMGGVAKRLSAEWNALCDPEATHIVFSSGAPIVMVGLDVTTQCRMEYEQVQAIGAADRPINKLCYELIHLWGGGNPEPRPMLHDPLAVAMAFDPSFCETSEMCIEVETRSAHIRGATIPTRKDPNASVCVSVDAERFMGTFVDTLTRL
jgi:inosine-uridine nucleoside N-ribohydrolase